MRARGRPPPDQSVWALRALEVRGVHAAPRDGPALHGVSLAVRSGEVVGLVGPRGSGASTLLDCVTGHARVAAGSVWFRGRDVTGTPPHRRARLGMKRTFADGGFLEAATLRQNLVTAQDSAPHPAGDPASDLLDRFGIAAFADAPVCSAPHTVRVLARIALAVAGGSGLVVLDEPASGLTASTAAPLAGVIRSLAGADGSAVLLSDPWAPFVLDVSDRVACLDHGAVVTSGPPSQVRADPRVAAVLAGAPLPWPGDASPRRVGGGQALSP